MDLSLVDIRLAAAAAEGLSLVERPYAELGDRIGMSEDQVIDGLGRLLATGTLKRLGVIVRHRELGYRANAMVVWDVPDERVPEVGRGLSALPFVTLCYRRPRWPPQWPYNLFCMIHGRDRAVVEAQVVQAARALDLLAVPRAVLFSRRRFKQRGGRHGAPARAG